MAWRGDRLRRGQACRAARPVCPPVMRHPRDAIEETQSRLFFVALDNNPLSR
ncbi:hypothetical protein B8V81_0397 [Paenibacillus pasadenensis]|uniref:Uncharacterized protein n=1 Tax=Paenibacillus pasadenensis TaxID=217090 RepID=A0A2N5ND41_9BACL|nr:hypothetical protein B8V81_0397 [Paenibacillus pasadenensis]